MNKFMKFALTSLLLVSTSHAYSQESVTSTKFKKTTETKIVGKWKGLLKGSTEILGKAYIGPNPDSNNVFHVWSGPTSKSQHCRYSLIRVAKQEDGSIVFKENNNGVRICKTFGLKIKRVGVKFVEVTRFDPETNREIWKGNLKKKRRHNTRQKEHDSALVKWATSPIEQLKKKFEDTAAEKATKAFENKFE